jgi:DNA-binding IclR family transcriptional regulator
VVRSPSVMQSVERISNVLLAFASDEPDLGVSEIARRLGLPKSAVHRTLTALCRTGLVRRDPQAPRYSLGPRAIELSLAAIGHSDIRPAALLIMQDVTARTAETTTLSLLAGDERFYAAQVESPQDVRMTIEPGRRCPLYAGASGRAILAFFDEARLDDYLNRMPLKPLTEATITDPDRLRSELARVRAAGYSASSGERDPWAAAVAAPIFARGGQVIGSISVCGPRGRVGEAEIRSHGATVREAAARLSRVLGGGTAVKEEA